LAKGKPQELETLFILRQKTFDAGLNALIFSANKFSTFGGHKYQIEMFEKIKETLANAGETIYDQAASMGEAAKDKGYKIIDGWISMLPKLEAYGFKTTYFALAVSINPTLILEMQSDATAFPLGRIDAILAENKGASSPINLFFTALKTTVVLHQKARIESGNLLTVKVSVRFSPEIKVSFGRSFID
jgi:hypothetical protein